MLLDNAWMGAFIISAPNSKCVCVCVWCFLSVPAARNVISPWNEDHYSPSTRNKLQLKSSHLAHEIACVLCVADHPEKA